MLFRFAFAAVLVFVFLPIPANAAQVYVEPATGSYGPGDTFIANIRINNEDECVNAAEVTLTYPKDVLRAVDFSRGGSILTLWIQEPTLDTDAGQVSFSGGVPGGYCGRIQGDPALSNVLGKVVFTVLQSDAEYANIEIDDSSSVLLHDGMGTPAPLTVQGARVTILPAATGSANPWLGMVEEDTIPPDPFKVEVQSTRGVFSGKYYAVFSTVDKQSGLSHYEIFERSAWKTVSSPYPLRDQTLRDVRIRAIDKAGNERLGEYEVGSAPPRQTSPIADWGLVIAGILALFIVGFIKIRMDRRTRPVSAPLPPTPPAAA